MRHPEDSVSTIIGKQFTRTHLKHKFGRQCDANNPERLQATIEDRFNLVAKQYGLTHMKSIHNLFLQVGADTGFPGLFLLVGIYGGTIIAVMRHRKLRTRYSPWYPYWVAMIVSSLAATTMCSQFIGMERVEVPYYICAVGLAAVKVAVTEQENAVLQKASAGGESKDLDQAKALPAA